jgi:hypothetical protein
MSQTAHVTQPKPDITRTTRDENIFPCHHGVASARVLISLGRKNRPVRINWNTTHSTVFIISAMNNVMYVSQM